MNKIYDIGYYGEGKYKARKNNNEMTIQYRYWFNMIQRCYSEKELNRNKTYENVTVCEEWHNFQNFAKWFDDNYYEVDGERMNLDKDILIKGNKIYSPETCVFVPQRINVIFTKRQNGRGSLPIGVRYMNKKFQARCNVKYKNEKSKSVNLGTYDNVYEAFNEYKKFKEKYIKEVADEYKSKIPKKLYDALYIYEVEITD